MALYKHVCMIMMIMIMMIMIMYFLCALVVLRWQIDVTDGHSDERYHIVIDIT